MKKILAHKKLVLVILVAVLLGGFGIWRILGNKSQTPQYQTAVVERGTIVATVAVSGQVATANSAQVTTEASGVVKEILVANGQQVTTGQAIATLELDLEGQQRQLAALASYNSAKNSLYTLQSAMLTKWKTYMDIAQSGTYQNSDGSPKTDTRQLPQYVSTNDDWLATEAQYKNQQNTIGQMALAYQQASPVVYAPIPGTLTGFSLQIGSVITAQSNSSGGSTAQKIASVKTQATPTVTVNLTEIDVPKIKIGNKATLTLDAFPGKTYTGKVISVDTVGAVSSGVTTYPTVIKMDTDSEDIFTNMSVQAKIITDAKSDVLIVPVSAVSTQNGTATVRVLKNGQVQSVAVETGLASTTMEEIVSSGLAEGDTVVTGQTTTATTQTGQTGSIFGGGGFGGGGAARIIGR